MDLSHTEVGARPIDVLERIQGILAKFPNYFRGKQVVLSTGISNNTNTSPRMLGLIDKQISLLEEAGAKVSVLGVGNRPDFNKKDLNGELSNIVKKHDPSKVTFTGALSDYGAMSKDHVHATNDAYKSILGQINGSPTQAAPEPVKGQAVDEDSRSVNDVKPKVINVIPIPLPSDSDDESDSEIHSSISLPYDATFSKYYTQSVAT